MNAKQREEEWKRKTHFTLESKKVDDWSRKKRIERMDNTEDKIKICPDWCKPSSLKAALRRQAYIDPEEIFGKVQPLNIEGMCTLTFFFFCTPRNYMIKFTYLSLPSLEIFKDRRAKFRQRSSSSNWTGADALTSEEEKEYKTRMGFR